MKNKKTNYLLLLIFTLLVLYLTLKDDFGNIYITILNSNKIWLLYGLLLVFGYWFFKALILKEYVRYYKKDYRFRTAFKLEMETLFFNGITPFSSGGQPFQIIVLKKDGVRVSDSTNIIFISSFIHQFSLFILSIIAIVTNQFLHLYDSNNTIVYLSILGFIINILFMIFLLFVMFSKKFKKGIVKFLARFLKRFRILKDKNKFLDSCEEKLDVLDEGSKVIIKNKTGFVKSLIYNILALICESLVPLVVAYSFGIFNAFTGIDSFITVMYVTLVGMFIPIPGGTGGLEYAFVVLFGNFVNSTVVKSLMLLWRFITYYIGMIIGSIVFNVDKLKKR